MDEIDSRSVEPTSTSLLARVRDNDVVAWQRLTGIYAPLVYGWCRSLGVPAQDAPDIVQNVFVAVHQSLSSFRREKAGDSFRGWLWTITRNRVCDHFRRAEKEPVPRGGSDAQIRWEELPEVEPPSTDSGDNPIDVRLLRGLEYVRVEFREQTWQAFWKSAAEGISTADVAKELSMSVGAVRKAKFRVLHRLREELQDLI